ncbi:hypothetical protein [Bradyrhizobium zhanjiangense]|uniref:hypothetical protein n=1 Tax=Bradyrhizobium zhanjiangense TaxID=1325107 RepID=UPI0013E8A5E2|nr:hypothetical protein [Bradyrhizobium zhanjiangense]
MSDGGGPLGIECARVLVLIDAPLFGGDNDGMEIWFDCPVRRRREFGIAGQR